MQSKLEDRSKAAQNLILKNASENNMDGSKWWKYVNDMIYRHDKEGFEQEYRQRIAKKIEHVG